MVMFPLLRKVIIVPIGLCLLALAGCGKMETSPEAAAPGAPAASPAQKSATPNSFDEVTAQLDPGGDFYLYLSTAQWLGKVSQYVDSLHDLLISGSAAQPAPDPAQTEKIFATLKDIVQKSGIEDITGVGASSLAVAPGLHRNKFFIHHYPDKGSGVLWSICGKEPHPLSALDFLPPDTAWAGVGDFDLAQLITFLRQEAEQSGLPEVKQAVDQWQTQFAAVSGQQIDDVLQSLNGSLGMIITLDATSTISIPINNQAQTIPTPRMALLIAVKNDLIFKQVDKMAGGNPGVIKVDQPDLQMRTMPLPLVPALNLRPTVAQWNGYLVIASDDQLLRDMIAVQKGAPGFKSTPEYTTLSAGLPQQGNSFWISTQRFAETARKFQGNMFANQPNTTPAQVAMMHRWFSLYQGTGRGFAVGVSMPNGYLNVGQASFTTP